MPIFSRTNKHFGLHSGPTRNLPTGWAERWVGYDDVGAEGITALFDALITIDPERLTHAIVDAVSDDKSLPAHVEHARLRLIAFGEAREKARHENAGFFGRMHRGDPQMGVDLDLKISEHRQLLRTFGVYAIHVEAYGRETEDPVITAHDSGSSVAFLVDPQLLHQVLEKTGIESDALHRPS